MSIREQLGLNVTSGDVGIEIEVEGTHLPSPLTLAPIQLDAIKRYWNITSDGSLRGEAYEYVFNKPLPFKEVEAALRLLDKAYTQAGSIVEDSVRAGIHVHINVQELEVSNLLNMIVIYYMLEEILIDNCGEDRQGNHFCLRSQDAEYILFALTKAFTTGMVGELATDNIRYASLNMLALFKYGSLEFRALRSTRDWNRTLMWTKALLDIREASFRFNSPKEVIESISQDGSLLFINKVLSKEVVDYFNMEGAEQKVLNGIRLVQSFVYSIKDLNVKMAMLSPKMIVNSKLALNTIQENSFQNDYEDVLEGSSKPLTRRKRLPLFIEPPLVFEGDEDQEDKEDEGEIYEDEDE